MKSEARHKMKQDEFVSLFSRVTHALAGNPKQTIIALIVIIALAGLFVAGSYYKGVMADRTNDVFQRGLTSYYGMRLDVPASGDKKPSPNFTAALTSFEQVGKSRLSPLRQPAQLMAAVTEAKLGRKADADAHLLRLATGSSEAFVARMAKLVRAENLYADGKYREAVAAYGELTQTTDPSFPTDYALLGLGLAQVKAGDRAAAVATFKKLKAQYAQSLLAQNADEEIRRIAPEQAEE